MVDINVQGGGIQALTAGGTQAIFSTITPNEGYEAWISDGTLVGTSLLRDIAPGRGNAQPQLRRTIGTRTWFAATTSLAGTEAWVTDGTGGGTIPLGDLFPGVDISGAPNGSQPNTFTDLGNGTVLFLGFTSAGTVLFRSDGTPGGTSAVATLSSNGPGFFNQLSADGGARIAGTNRAVFCVDGKVFTSDGTVAGTTELALPGGVSAPTLAVSGCGGAFLYGLPSTKFYFTDGTVANTRLLDAGGYIAMPPAVVGNRLVFSGDGILKSTDGTQAGMLTLDATVTNRYFAVANGSYWVTSGGGILPSQLRRTDGTVAGTVVVTASGIYFNDPVSFAGVGANTWFIGYQVIGGRDNRQVYRSDGTTATRVVVWNNSDTTALEAGLAPTATMVSVGQHLFIKDRGRLLGFNTATNQTTELSVAMSSGLSSTPQYLCEFKDGLLYWADDYSTTGAQRSIKPWFYRPDSGLAPVALSNIRPNPTDSGAQSLPLATPFFSMGEFALFGANNDQSPVGAAANGMELWKTDGTTGGTSLLKDLIPGSGYGYGMRIFGFVPGSTTTVILVGNITSTFSDSELLLSDGTAAGTVPLKDLNPGSAGSYPFTPTDMGTYWLFNASSAGNGRELWRTDGTATGTIQVKDINPGAGDSLDPYGAPVSYVRVGSTAFFPANNGVNGVELWKSDGTTSGTVLVKDINPGSASSSPLDLCVFNGKVYFVATTASNGRELWVSDGTAAGTTLVKDIIPGSASSVTSPNFGYGFLTVSASRLWFVADDATHGRELWSSDGTAAGTTMFKDIKPGTLGSDPYALIDVDGVLCFAADDGQTGVELWQTDGTLANTFLAGDINTGPASSHPLYRDPTDSVNYQVIPDAVVRNGVLYFSARAASVGRELWRYTPARITGAAGTIAFSSAMYSVGEAAGNAVITVTRTGGDGAATVNVQTEAGGTATAGSDYVATSGQVTFLTGETTKSFIVPIINDGIVEPAQTVLLTITSPTGGALLGQATATLTISDGGAANQAPVATTQAVSTPKNTPRTITLAGTDPDGQVVTMSGVSAPSSGTLTGSGSIRTFTPATNFTGSVTFTFTVTDGIAVSAPATVTITVTDTVNQAPTASAQSISTPVNTAVAITLTGSDPEGSGLLLNSITTPAHGMLLGSGQGLNRTYVPDAGYTGPDSFTFTLSDGSLTSSSATVAITVGTGGVNRLPIILSPTDAAVLSVQEDLPGDLAVSATDADVANVLTWTTSTPTKGTISGGGTGSSRTLIYTPTANATGSDSFVVTVSDGAGGSATRSVTVAITAVNDPPVNTAVPVISGTATVGQTLSATTGIWNDTKDGNPGPTVFSYQWRRATAASGGTVTAIPGATSSSYLLTSTDLGLFLEVLVTATDSGSPGTAAAVAASARTTAVVNVTPGNLAPSATAQSVTVTEDTAAGITLAGIDSDGSISGYTVLTQPTKGVLTGTAPNLTYTPDLDQTGSDSFTFRVTDNQGATSAAAVVSLTLSPVNDPPVNTVLPLISGSATVGQTVSVSSGTWTDAKDGNLAPTVFTYQWRRAATAAGTALPISGATAATYVIASGNAGQYLEVQVTAIDAGTPGTASATVTTQRIGPVQTGSIPVNQSPTATAQSVTVTEDTAASITLSGSDSDGSIAGYTVLTQPTKGVLTGTLPDLTYTPNLDQTGSDSFTFRVTDDQGATSAAAVVSLSITAVNDPPVNTAVPVISGTATVGQTLSATPGTWNDTKDGNSGPTVFTYQWRQATAASGGTVTAIAGATASSYVLTSADLGAFVEVRVTATDSGSPGTAAAVASSARTSQVTAPVSNTPPTVNAGIDQTITLPATATLTATVTDDGLPAPSALTYAWAKVSGPGTVTFATPTAEDTTASFSTSGTYVLRLTASDGALSANDTITVIVQPAPVTDGRRILLEPVAGYGWEAGGLPQSATTGGRTLVGPYPSASAATLTLIPAGGA